MQTVTAREPHAPSHILEHGCSLSLTFRRFRRRVCELLGAGYKWFSVLIERLDLHTPLFVLHVLSHSRSDFNRRHTYPFTGIYTMVNRRISLRARLRPEVTFVRGYLKIAQPGFHFP